MKLTPWYPASIKPVRPGVYQTYASGGAMYQYWNGRFWCMTSFNREWAESYADKPSTYNRKPTWRGLAKEPK